MWTFSQHMSASANIFIFFSRSTIQYYTELEFKNKNKYTELIRETGPRKNNEADSRNEMFYNFWTKWIKAPHRVFTLEAMCSAKCRRFACHLLTYYMNAKIYNCYHNYHALENEWDSFVSFLSFAKFGAHCLSAKFSVVSFQVCWDGWKPKN